MAPPTDYAAAQAKVRQQYFRALADMQQGTYSEKGDIIDWTLWDRFPMLSTILTHNMFVIGTGGTPPAGGQKTLADTNLQGTQGIPQGQNLVVRAIKIFYFGEAVHTEATIQLLQLMLAQTVLNINIAGKASYGQWALDEIMGNPAGFIVSPAVPGDGPQVGGYARYVGILPLNLPIILAALTTFECTVTHFVTPSAALDGDLVKIGLNGVLMRLS